ncbi:heteromeric transposase endonuclease subunit TnsA [Teredinibacter turnerae]|uniref:heteromeric transposase endonuclease subunit TnsA n=1 Tax=Teredinibacter turnerae TaxID=2426 RepID=UPI000362BD74|nr:heteromeric transposase endonuclease subunit TnsA [Teredinibacter turnerae]
MGKKQYWNSEAKNARWIKEGRGQGAGSAYKPWLTVRDVPSEGRSHRVFGHLTQRTHHLLSDLELATFLLLQWRSTVTDIREQFPLERALTQELCTRLGVEHPNQRGVDQYMSSDFVVDSKEKDRPRFVLQVKAKKHLEVARVVEKLEVERSYWKEKEIPFYLVTEGQIPPTVFENINLLYNYADDSIDQTELSVPFELFRQQLPQHESLRLIDLCIHLDTAYSQEPGESLYQIKRLLALRYFHFDITTPFTKLRCSNLSAENTSVLQEGWCVPG